MDHMTEFYIINAIADAPCFVEALPTLPPFWRIAKAEGCRDYANITEDEAKDREYNAALQQILADFRHELAAMAKHELLQAVIADELPLEQACKIWHASNLSLK